MDLGAGCQLSQGANNGAGRIKRFVGRCKLSRQKSRLFGCRVLQNEAAGLIFFCIKIMVDRLYVDRHNARLFGWDAALSLL